MSPAQADLLRRLITADRCYRSAVARGEAADPDHRGVEVVALNGVSRRTALALVEAGVAEMVDTRCNGNAWLFLGSCDPLDP